MPAFCHYPICNVGKLLHQVEQLFCFFFFKADSPISLSPEQCSTVVFFQGVLHTVSGYMLYTALTFKMVFDYHPYDIYWCTADIGWITGHSYITYGPLANGATSVLVREHSKHCIFLKKFRISGAVGS